MSRWNWEWDFLALSKTSDELPLPTFLPVTRQKKNSLTRVDLKSPLQPSDFMILRSQTNIKWGRRKNHSYGRLPSQYGWWLMHPLYHVPQALLLFILIATLEGQCYDWTHFPDKALSEFNALNPSRTTLGSPQHQLLSMRAPQTHPQPGNLCRRSVSSKPFSQ